MYDLALPFTLYSPDGARSRTLQGAVDTGASFTVVPEAMLDELGVERGELLLFRLADGSLQERSTGYVLMELEGRSETVTAVFGRRRRSPVPVVVKCSQAPGIRPAGRTGRRRVARVGSRVG